MLDDELKIIFPGLPTVNSPVTVVATSDAI